ncbi:penicillin-binding protein [Pseudonocardia sp. CNS-139]|nr:penicillin-binding protein [Pseudonocardia sp. CNS-139]
MKRRRVMRPVGLLLGLSLLSGVLAAGVGFPVAAGAGLAANQASDTVTGVSEELLAGVLPTTTTVTDRHGRPLAHVFGQDRDVVTTDQVSSAMIAAIVAVEDRRFFEHEGVDWQGTARAVLANSASGDIEQGASTLTQQYVKNFTLYVLADTDVERMRATEQTPARKLRETQIAMQLEQQLSKNEILARYLNTVYWGNGAYGVAAAARTYFGVTPAELTVPQAALLAGMVRSTAGFDPVHRPEAALARRDLVIQQMHEQGMIGAEQARLATESPLGVVSPLQVRPNGCLGAGDAGFFCAYVMQYLLQSGFSYEQLAGGGYTVRTTLDPDVMTAMTASLRTEVPPDSPDAADVMSVVEPGSHRHRVLAMGSSRVYGLNAAVHQTSYGLPFEPVNLGAGSVYKIFTSATAMEKGLGIESSIEVPPSGYASPIYRDGAGRPIPVQNSGSQTGRMSLADALAQSPNTAFVRLMEFTGVPDVVDMAVRLGMRSLATTPFVNPATGRPTDRSIAEVTKAQRQASFTLGVSPTSVLELANVGATLASGGVWCPPTPVESVTDPAGNPVPLTEAPCEQAVEAGLANSLIVGLSRDDKPGGTAFGAASQVAWTRPMAGKTGTTQNHQSAAFLGVVPEMSGAVITFDNSSSPRPLCDGPGAPFACGRGNIFGGKTPAETWFGTMTPLLAGRPPTPLPPTDPRFVHGGQAATVPEVVGRAEPDARGFLERAGWRVATQTVDSVAPPGTVIGQVPRGTALPGQVVTLQVSTGSVPPPPPPPGGG